MAKRFILKKDLFVRHPEEDFSDDGTRFYIYYYKNILPISRATWNGMTFTSIRLDYLGIKFEDRKEDLKILDEFNGVKIETADQNKLIENCEYILNKYLK